MSLSDGEVRLERLTRKEAWDRIQSGVVKVGIIVTGSIEQHLEHLPMDHDIRSATMVAEDLARRVYPKALVTVPLRAGMSEHHMEHRFGTITMKPGTFHAAVFDSCDSFIRHGITDIFILNGHGGNEAPMNGSVNQFRRYWQDASIYFHSYWHFTPAEVAERELRPDSVPGHAQEFETSLALHMFPEMVRKEMIPLSTDEGVRLATVEKGATLYEAILGALVEHVEGMSAGQNKAEIDGL